MNDNYSVADYIVYLTKGITPKYVNNSSVVVINQKCIRNHRIDYSLSQFTVDDKSLDQNKFLKKGDIIVNSTGTGTAGRCAFVADLSVNSKVVTDSHMLILRCNSYEEAACLSYSLNYFENTLMSFLIGSSGQAELDKVMLLNTKVIIPQDLISRKRVVSLLLNIDRKIDLNQKINIELEKLAKSIYDYWFIQFDFPDENGKPYKSNGGKMVWNEELKREIPDGWNVGNLLDIANYVNGIACQKYRPKDDDNKLRVIKIKEIHEGFSSETEFVSSKIPKKVFIENGDVLFSWSASLEVVLWAGGKGALNQHIFKITSNEYPKSFYYFHLLNYLNHFKMMAENRKTTMGHITQEHLEQSRVVLPPRELTNDLEKNIGPLLSLIVKNQEENQQLSELRDWLLPMLMNGQVKVA